MRSILLLSAVFSTLTLTQCKKVDDCGKDKKDEDKGVAVQSSQLKENALPGKKLYMAEYMTSSESQQMGRTIYYFNVGNKQLGAHFVPADPRRGGSTDITYAIDNEATTDNGLTPAEVAAAIASAMETWEGVNCAKFNITRVPYNGNLGVYSLLTGFGGSFDIVADIQHSGFLPKAFFNLLAPGGGDFIIGVTLTFVFDDGTNLTDIDNNGMPDVAFREIYYNDAFTYRTNTGAGIDIETVALHESGHGLSQAHFGKAFTTNANGKLHFAPLALMNAAYVGQLRYLLGTDNAGHCSIWGSWPE